MSRAAALALLVVLAGSSDAGAQRRRWQPIVRPVAVDPPEALGAFQRALLDLDRGLRRRVRVMHFGDSHVASDLWTSVVRQALQARFGDGGPGYLLPPPHGAFHVGPADLAAGAGWQTRRRGRRFGPLDGLWGLAGTSMEAVGPDAWATVDVPDLVDGAVVEVHLLARPGGGALEISIGDRTERVDLSGERAALVVRRYLVPPGVRRVMLRAGGGRPVRVLGVSVESRLPGVVYDVLGVNGQRAAAILDWSPRLLDAQLRMRPPDLVVLSFGGNEALDPRLPLDRYEAQLRGAVSRMREAAPEASCLLVGPTATCPARERVVEIAAIQRRVAPELGCGFWDSASVSGGAGSLCGWIHSDDDLVAGDRLHLRPNGYELMGRELTAALVGGY